MSSDIDCFFFPELTFRSWFLLFCSVFKDLFFAPFRVPDYITTTWWALQAFFSSFLLSDPLSLGARLYWQILDTKSTPFFNVSVFILIFEIFD